MIVGYTTGVFDLFHVGHLNVLKAARALCDKLIVGVTTDELAIEYKKKKPVVPFMERIEIIKSIKCVDLAVRREVYDKHKEWRKLKFDILFVGDDWYGTDNWNHYEAELSLEGVKVIYLPHTPGTSSTELKKKLEAESNGL